MRDEPDHQDGFDHKHNHEAEAPRSCGRSKKAKERYAEALADQPTVGEALAGKEAGERLLAIREEFGERKELKTYELVPEEDVSEGQGILPSDIKLKLKREKDMSADKRKARL